MRSFANSFGIRQGTLFPTAAFLCQAFSVSGAPAPVAPAPVAPAPVAPAPVAEAKSPATPPAQSKDWGARLPTGAKAPLEALPEAVPAPAKPAAEPPPMAIPIVQGYDSFGLSIPDLDEAGRLRSIFVIGAVSRVDDRNVEIRDSFLETYKDDGSRDFSIELKKATLDRFTRVLVAKVPVTIRREEFEVRGESMEFNTTTREGGLGGPVKMVIYNGLGGDVVPSSGAPGASRAGSVSVGSNPAVPIPAKTGKPPSQ